MDCRKKSISIEHLFWVKDSSSGRARDVTPRTPSVQRWRKAKQATAKAKKKRTFHRQIQGKRVQSKEMALILSMLGLIFTNQMPSPIIRHMEKDDRTRALNTPSRDCRPTDCPIGKVTCARVLKDRTLELMLYQTLYAVIVNTRRYICPCVKTPKIINLI